jgi:hypothetical protein
LDRICLYVEKKNCETNEWETVKGPNSLIIEYKELAKNASEQGELEIAKQFESKAAYVESGAMLIKKLMEIEEKYPKKRREIDEKLLIEYDDTREKLYDRYNPETFTNWLYIKHDVSLFSILSNVQQSGNSKNESLTNRFMPVSLPKGLPINLSKFVIAAFKRTIENSNNHSYFYLKEILEHKWGDQEINNTIKKECVHNPVSNELFEKNLIKSSNLAKKVVQNKKSLVELSRTSIFLDESPMTTENSLAEKPIDILNFISKNNPNNVRIVFWFLK